MDDWYQAVWPPLGRELERDWVGFWQLDHGVKLRAPELDASARRGIALEILAQVLQRGEADVGQFKKDRDGLVLWSGSVDEQLARIRSEWEAVGEPDINDIGWLQHPSVRQRKDN